LSNLIGLPLLVPTPNTDNNTWKGVANYRSKNYVQAAKDFSASNNNALANYNQGNTLAHLGKFQQAIAAYNQASKLNPELKDAKYNRDYLEKLLKQKKKQQKNHKNQSQQNQSQQNKQQQQKKQQSKSKQNKNQSKSQQHSQAQQHNQSKQNNNNKQQQRNKQQPSQSQSQQQQNQKQSQQRDQNKSRQQQTKLTAKEREKQQALRQWLNRVPDNPGGLLKQKFQRDYMRRQAQQ